MEWILEQPGGVYRHGGFSVDYRLIHLGFPDYSILEFGYAQLDQLFVIGPGF